MSVPSDTADWCRFCKCFSNGGYDICSECFDKKIAEAEQRGFEKGAKEADKWEQQFAQARMVIEDIKSVTGCESDDGCEILESVEALKRKADAVLVLLDAKIAAAEEAESRGDNIPSLGVIGTSSLLRELRAEVEKVI